MQHITRPLTLFSLVVALIVAVSSVVPVSGQQAPARKKVLFLTYPGVGGPGSRGHESLPYAEEQAVEFGKTGGFDVTTHRDYTQAGKQDLAFFTPEYLNQFDALMLMANGDIGLSTDQKKMIVDFVRGGKGLIGVHCAALLMYDYPEFGEILGGYYFAGINPIGGTSNAAASGEPPIPPNSKKFGVLKVEDNTHPATRMLTTSWPIVEEFYAYATAPWSPDAPELNISRPGDFKAPMGFSRDRVHVLLSLDTENMNLDGLSPRARVTKGGDFPQSWWRYFGNGRSFYTSLGHAKESWTNDAVFRAHLTGGIRWALGLEN
jgi:type 1 glutamine amidotransferase